VKIEKLNSGATRRTTGRDINEFLADLLGDRFRRYRDAWNKAGPNAIPAFPVHIDLEFVDRCNQSCVFCARNKIMHPDIPYSVNTGGKMDEDIIDKVIEQTTMHGLYSINIAWGEPLLYKNIFEIIKRFSTSGVVDLRLVTNGLLLGKFIDEVFESRLVNLYVSIDAFSDETYSILRGKGYQEVVENLLTFIEEKRYRKSFLPIIRVSFVETDENRHEMEMFKVFWTDKVDIVDIQILTEFNKREYEDSKNKKWSCIEPFRRLSIIANGDILPCCAFPGKELIIGNISDMTIKEAWNSEKMKFIRENLLDDKEPICLICQGC